MSGIHSRFQVICVDTCHFVGASRTYFLAYKMAQAHECAVEGEYAVIIQDLMAMSRRWNTWTSDGLCIGARSDVKRKREAATLVPVLKEVEMKWQT